MKAKRPSFVSAEPEEVRAWRKYAKPFNNHLVERTKGSIWLDNSIPVQIKPVKKEPHNTHWSYL